LRTPILLGGVVFHLGTLFFMNIFFPYHLAMYSVFVDWERLRERLVWSSALGGYFVAGAKKPA
jgi:hypothetical protein